MSTDPIARQLADELASRWSHLAVFVPGGATKRPPDFSTHARRAAGVLTEGPPHERAETVADIMRALHPGGAPEPTWWATPLGAECAREFDRGQRLRWTQQYSADVLEVARGTIATLISRGTISQDDDGVVPSSVVDYARDRRRVVVDDVRQAEADIAAGHGVRGVDAIRSIRSRSDG